MRIDELALGPKAGHLSPSVPASGIDLNALALLDEQIDEGVFGSSAEFTFEELAERSGWTTAELRKMYVWAGLPHVNTNRYTLADVAGLSHLKKFSIEEELDEEMLSAIVRSIGFAMERLSVWQVEAFIQFLAKRHGIGDTAARMEAAGYAPTRGHEIVSQLTSLWLRHYARSLRRLTVEAVLQRGVSDHDGQFPLLRAVGFVQIDDFNTLTKHMAMTEYANLVQNFHNRVNDIVRVAGGRVNNTIGDGVLWVADDINTGADIALELSKLNERGFAAPARVGLTWGRIIVAYGNIFGPTVNQAMHIAYFTPPNQVYVNNAAAAILARYPKYYTVEDEGIALKGYDDVTAHQLRNVTAE